MTVQGQDKEYRTKEYHSNDDQELLELVRKHIPKDSKGEYFSGFIRANAETLHHLVNAGLLKCAKGYENYDGFYRGYAARELND